MALMMALKMMTMSMTMVMLSMMMMMDGDDDDDGMHFCNARMSIYVGGEGNVLPSAHCKPEATAPSTARVMSSSTVTSAFRFLEGTTLNSFMLLSSLFVILKAPLSCCQVARRTAEEALKTARPFLMAARVPVASFSSSV